MNQLKLRKDFEKTNLFIQINRLYKVYWTDLGGYHHVDDKKCSFYLNGAFSMFQELNT